MSRESLTAEKREAGGSPVARRLRRQGRVPGVVYSQRGNLTFSASVLDVAALMRHGATLVDVDVDGTKLTTVIKDHQKHPVRGDVMHIDLQEVSMDETITSVIALHYTGTAEGVKEGGVLSEGTHELQVESTPGNIPDSIDIDVSALGVGDSIHLREITLPAGVTSTEDPDTVLASVTAPRGAATEGADEGAEGAEGADGGTAAAGSGGGSDEEASAE